MAASSSPRRAASIKVYDNLADTTPTTFSGLPPNVHNFWDRGLLGLALDPSLTNPALPLRPWVYVLYTYDHILGSPRPRRAGATPARPPRTRRPTAASSAAGCRGSRSAARRSPAPRPVLIEDWCQQFPSHSVGDLGFGPDGALYVSAGDGASFNVVDYGQLGGTLGNSAHAEEPCGDPPGDAMIRRQLEGGALRSQDIRTEPAGAGGRRLRQTRCSQDTPIA